MTVQENLEPEFRPREQGAKRISRTTFAAAALLSLLLGTASPCSAASITYYVNQTIGAGGVTGDIVTDGKIGTLGQTDIVDWNLLLNDGTNTRGLLGPLSGSNSVVFVNFLTTPNLSATATRLLFNFSASNGPFPVGVNELIFQNTVIPTSGYLCFNSGGCTAALPLPPPGTGVEQLSATPNLGNFQGTDLSGTQVIGTTAILPIPCQLQTVPPTPGLCYQFNSGPSGAWFDPATASGYTYQMTGGSLFTDILGLPTGFLQPFDVTSPGCAIPGTFQPGQSVDFVAICGQGVSTFTVTGIDPLFDPTDTGAFPIQLAFNTPTADFVASPLTSTSSVPEPSSWAMFLAGLFGLGLITLRRGMPRRA